MPRVLVSTALSRALKAAKLGPEHEATVALAKQYASAIDSGGDLTKLGPPLLATLQALGMTRTLAGAVGRGEVPASGPTGTAAASLTLLRDRAKRRGEQTG